MNTCMEFLRDGQNMAMKASDPAQYLLGRSMSSGERI